MGQLSGCALAPTLQAAHKLPYNGTKSNHVSNGILLRVDIHTFFDFGLVRIDPETRKVVVVASLMGTDYEQYAGTAVLPQSLVYLMTELWDRGFTQTQIRSGFDPIADNRIHEPEVRIQTVLKRSIQTDSMVPSVPVASKVAKIDSYMRAQFMGNARIDPL